MVASPVRQAGWTFCKLDKYQFLSKSLPAKPITILTNGNVSLAPLKTVLVVPSNCFSWATWLLDGTALQTRTNYSKAVIISSKLLQGERCNTVCFAAWRRGRSNGGEVLSLLHLASVRLEHNFSWFCSLSKVEQVYFLIILRLGLSEELIKYWSQSPSCLHLSFCIFIKMTCTN